MDWLDQPEERSSIRYATYPKKAAALFTQLYRTTRTGPWIQSAVPPVSYMYISMPLWHERVGVIVCRCVGRGVIIYRCCSWLSAVDGGTIILFVIAHAPANEPTMPPDINIGRSPLVLLNTIPLRVPAAMVFAESCFPLRYPMPELKQL